MLFGLFGSKGKQVDVYCQSCGNEITDEGGDVSNTGRIYCHGYKSGTDDRCMDAELFIQIQRSGVASVSLINYRSAEQV